MAAGDLTTVAAVQAFLSLPSTQDNALLQTLITNASAFIGQMTNRNLLQSTYVELYNGYGSDQLLPNNFPITAISSITIDDQAIPASTAVAMDGFVFDSSVVYLRGYSFTRGRKNVTISYTAGYATVPLELAQACVEVVATKYKRRTELHISGKTLDNQTITYTTSDVPASAMSIIKQYSRVHHSP